jgi:hypothetical protein
VNVLVNWNQMDLYGFHSDNLNLYRCDVLEHASRTPSIPS